MVHNIMPTKLLFMSLFAFALSIFFVPFMKALFLRGINGMSESVSNTKGTGAEIARGAGEAMKKTSTVFFFVARILLFVMGSLFITAYVCGFWGINLFNKL